MKSPFVNVEELFQISMFNADCKINIKYGCERDFIIYSVEQGVAGYFYLQSKNNKLKISESLISELKPYYLKTYVENLKKKEALDEILLLFEQNGLECILLKGLSLIDLLYNNIGARPFGDIDLFVLPENIEKSKQLLFSLGYSQISESLWKIDEKEHHHLRPFIRENIVIELHHHAYHSKIGLEIDVNEIWKRKIPVKNQKYNILSYNDYYFYLGIHLMDHLKMGQGRLSHFYDLINFLWLYNSEIEQSRILKEYKKSTKDFIIIHDLLSCSFHIPDNQKNILQKHDVELLRVVLPDNRNVVRWLYYKSIFRKTFRKKGMNAKFSFLFKAITDHQQMNAKMFLLLGKRLLNVIFRLFFIFTNKLKLIFKSENKLI